MAGALGGHHDDIHVITGNDLVVMDIETVGESQGCALLHVRAVNAKPK